MSYKCLAFLLLLPVTAFCQVNIIGSVYDGATDLPLPNAVVISASSQTTTNTLGVFALRHVYETDTLAISLIGYELKKITVKMLLQASSRVSLQRMTIPLPEFTFLSPASALSIIDRAINKIPDNYLPSSIALQMCAEAWIHRKNDTIYYAGRDIFWQHPKGKILRYWQYATAEGNHISKKKDSSFVVKPYLEITHGFPGSNHISSTRDMLKDATINMAAIQTIGGVEKYHITGIRKQQKQDIYKIQTVDIWIDKQSLAFEQIDMHWLEMADTDLPGKMDWDAILRIDPQQSRDFSSSLILKKNDSLNRYYVSSFEWSNNLFYAKRLKPKGVRDKGLGLYGLVVHRASILNPNELQETTSMKYTFIGIVPKVPEDAKIFLAQYYL